MKPYRLFSLFVLALLLSAPTARADGPAGTPVAADATAGDHLFPNPWRSDRDAGHPMTFHHLLTGSSVTIFTIAAEKVRSLSVPANSVDWDLTNEDGDRVASGIYLYRATGDQGQSVHGKLAIIR